MSEEKVCVGLKGRGTPEGTGWERMRLWDSLRFFGSKANQFGDCPKFQVQVKEALNCRLTGARHLAEEQGRRQELRRLAEERRHLGLGHRHRLAQGRRSDPAPRHHRL